MIHLQDFSKFSYICLNDQKCVHNLWLFEAPILFSDMLTLSFLTGCSSDACTMTF